MSNPLQIYQKLLKKCLKIFKNLHNFFINLLEATTEINVQSRWNTQKILGISGEYESHKMSSIFLKTSKDSEKLLKVTRKFFK